MRYKEVRREARRIPARNRELRGKMRGAQAAIEPEEIQDYELRLRTARCGCLLCSATRTRCSSSTIWGPLVPNCTMWADGFNGVYLHLRDRAAFSASSPDPPERQRVSPPGAAGSFRWSRTKGTTFAEDMGYRPNGRAMPGVSVFKRKDDKILRVADTAFTHGDDL